MCFAVIEKVDLCVPFALVYSTEKRVLFNRVETVTNGRNRQRAQYSCRMLQFSVCMCGIESEMKTKQLDRKTRILLAEHREQRYRF